VAQIDIQLLGFARGNSLLHYFVFATSLEIHSLCCASISAFNAKYIVLIVTVQAQIVIAENV